MSLNRIQVVFDTILNSFADDQGIKFIEANMAVNTKTNYLMPFILPSNAVAIANTAESTVRYTGIYQINVYQKKGSGMGWSRFTADKLLGLFPQGQFLDDDCLRIVSSYVSSAISYNDLFVMTPITINYDGLYGGVDNPYIPPEGGLNIWGEPNVWG